MYHLVRAGVVSVLDRVVSRDAYAHVLGPASELEEGVVCMAHDPATDFKVQLTVATSGAVKSAAERALAAIAASMPEVCLDLRWTQSSCVQGGKNLVTAALESPGRRLPPSRVANALAVALADLLDARSAKNVEVVGLGGQGRRGSLFRKLVAHAATAFGSDAGRPGQACTFTYSGRDCAVSAEWRDAPDDAAGRDPPSSIPGLDEARSEAAKAKAAAAAAEAAAAKKSPGSAEGASALGRHLSKMKEQLGRDQGASKAKTQSWIDVAESLQLAEKPSPPPKSIGEVERSLDAAVHGMRDVKDVVLGMASHLMRQPS